MSSDQTAPPSSPDRLPPHSPEAEQGALGCCLLSPVQCIPETVAKLGRNGDAFYDLRHQTIYRHALALHDKGVPVDVIVLQQALKDNRVLEEVGGIAYLSALPDAVPSAANLSYYLDIVAEKHQLRRLVQTCTEVVSRVYDYKGEVPALLEGVEQDLLNVTRATNGNLPTILDAAEWLATPAELPSELVCGLLHRGSKLVMGGGSKTFKTWTLLDLAISVSAGVPWLSCNTFKGKVLYLNFEIPPAFFQRRIDAIARAKGITLAPHTLEVWNLRGRATGYTEILPKIRQRIQRADYALLVLDPIYKLYGDTDENSAGEVAGLMNALELVTVDTGAAIAFGAHYAKGNAAGKEAIDRISGSGVFARDPDSILNFTRHETEDAFTVEATLRNLAPIKPFVVRWQFPLMVADSALDPSKLKRVGGRKQEHSADDLLGVLSGQSLTTTEWQSTAKTEAGIKERNFYTLMKELQQSGRVLKSAINHKWQRVSK